jgi:hypothetical protein
MKCGRIKQEHVGWACSSDGNEGIAHLEDLRIDASIYREYDLSVWIGSICLRTDTWRQCGFTKCCNMSSYAIVSFSRKALLCACVMRTDHIPKRRGSRLFTFRNSFGP